MNDQTKPLAYIIEDDDQLADIFTQAIKMAGFETQTVADGQQAIEALANLDPSVVILDLYLPGASGEEVLAFIRNERRFQKVIVVLTTFDSLLADDLREQSNFVLLKPVSFSQLRDLGIHLRTAIE
jgi:two-component system, NtrC family, phosphoglycerate transport system response regulator PgtA